MKFSYGYQVIPDGAKEYEHRSFVSARIQHATSLCRCPTRSEGSREFCDEALKSSRKLMDQTLLKTSPNAMSLAYQHFGRRHSCPALTFLRKFG